MIYRSSKYSRIISYYFANNNPSFPQTNPGTRKQMLYIENWGEVMSMISLLSTTDAGMTVINNTFIDEYMPKANGSFVKVYLYLLRCLQSSFSDLSLTYLADKLDETEKDIERAIKYWEKEHLLVVTRQTGNVIDSITFLAPVSTLTQAPASLPAKPQTAAVTVPVSESGNKEAENADEISKKGITIHKPNYSDAQIKQLTEMEEVKWIMNTIERLLERLLKPTDVQLVLFLYESLGFSAELIYYLYDYCISKNKKSVSYIESVAIAWAEEGIDSVDKAESSTAVYNNNYNAVNKAFGLNRAPGTIEKKYMHRWFNEFKFDIPIIEEACNRTILAVNKPDFKYADKILENWHKKGVISKKDIEALDTAHAKQSAAAAQNKQNAANKQPASNNKFNAFPQRKYTDEDFLSMEQRLLNQR